MKKSLSRSLSRTAIIAALYVILTLFSAALGLSGGVIQVRFSEALTLLPLFFPEAVLGVTLGCFLANLLTGAVIWDVIFGTLATLLGAVITSRMSPSRPVLGAIPPIAANTLIIPPVLRYACHLEGGLLLMTLTVLAGEIISCGFLGLLLVWSLKKHKIIP